LNCVTQSLTCGAGNPRDYQHLQEAQRSDLSVNAIGPAGENKVAFASWLNENDRAAGRGGTGCVGGAKMLKAVVVKADKGGQQKAANRADWRAAQRNALAKIMDESTITSPRKGGLSLYGTNMLMNVANTIGALGSRNSQATNFGDGAEKLGGEYVKEHYLIHDPTCHACPVACKKEVEITAAPTRSRWNRWSTNPRGRLGRTAETTHRVRGL
jgi:aldehyde:ferredoxin oxidoreductase